MRRSRRLKVVFSRDMSDSPVISRFPFLNWYPASFLHFPNIDFYSLHIELFLVHGLLAFTNIDIFHFVRGLTVSLGNFATLSKLLLLFLGFLSFPLLFIKTIWANKTFQGLCVCQHESRKSFFLLFFFLFLISYSTPELRLMFLFLLDCMLS